MRYVAAAVCLGAAGVAVASVAVATVEDGARHDALHYIAEANKASLVMLVEEDLVAPELGRAIARAVAQIIDEQSVDGAPRSANYLDFENRLVEIAGDDGSRIHIGRSRQDLHGTARRMQVRAGLLVSLEALLGARAAVVDLAARHPDAVIPAYTHGVQAQPTSLGHTRRARLVDALTRHFKGVRPLGGPQPESVRAMLAQRRRSLAESHDWLTTTREHLAAARVALEAAFQDLK